LQKPRRKIEEPQGWTVYIVKCADGTYFSGLCRNLKKALKSEIYNRKGEWFINHPERLPVTLVFTDAGLFFREAYAKFLYLRKQFDKPMKERLIRSKRWPIGGPYKEYLIKKFEKELKP
jgi:predicted GIY-YIG superfamily endonuclease